MHCLAIFPDESSVPVYNVTGMVKILRRTFCIACLVLLVAALAIESIHQDQTGGKHAIDLELGKDVVLLRAQVSNEPADSGAEVDQKPQGATDPLADQEVDKQKPEDSSSSAEGSDGSGQTPNAKKESPGEQNTSKKAKVKQEDAKEGNTKSGAGGKTQAAGGAKAKGPSASSSGGKPGVGIPSLAAGADVAIIRIEGVIDDYTLRSLRHRVELVKAQKKATVIVLELDTPGGRLDSSLKISSFIKTLNPEFHTIAWVNNQAYSAGSLLAAACDQIIMASKSNIGDTAPIIPGMNIAPTERAKILSPLLEEFRDSALDNHYDFAMFHAMCQIGVELYLIENPKTGQRHLVNQADYAVMVKGRSGPTPIQNIQKAIGLKPAPSVVSRELATDADKGKWIAVQKSNGIRFPDGLVHDGKLKLLTLSQDRAIAIGLSRGLVDDDKQLKAFLNAASVERVDSTWAHGFGYWLTRPWMKALLVFLMIVGGLIEMSAPGFGVGGVIAISAVSLLIVGPILTDLWQIWPVLLFLVGLGLLLAEIFLTPGFGLLGAGGIVCMFVGVALLGMPGNMSNAEWLGHLQSSITWLLVALIGTGVSLFFISKHFGRIPIFDRIILKDPKQVAVPTGTARSYAEAVRGTGVEVEAEPSSISGDEVIGHGNIHVDDLGKVITELRPTGSAEINGMIVDVVSLGQWIEMGERIKVVEIHGNRIVVDKLAPA